MFFISFVVMSTAFAEKYDRNEWGFGRKKIECKDTRALVLIKESEVPVTFTKRKDNKKCTVATGKWKDFYYDGSLTKANDIDADHVVPLKHAHDAGGSKWTKSKKEQFANDHLNIVLTHKRYNRQKGAKTPLEWMPLDRGYACKYMKLWMVIKEKYELDVSKKEKEHLVLLDCKK